MAVGRLLISTFSSRKMRSAITVAAIALSVSLVVAVTSGYTSLQAAIDKFVNYYLGANSLDIRTTNDVQQAIPESLIDELRLDADVERVTPRLAMDLVMAGVGEKQETTFSALGVGVMLPQDQQVAAMKMDAGGWPQEWAGDVAVIDQVAAERLGAQVGDTITLLHPQNPRQVKVVGIVHKPTFLAMQLQTVYLPLATLQDFVARQGRLTRILVDLNDDDTEAAFVQRWSPKLADMKPELRIRRPGDRRKEMERNLEGVRFLTYLGGTVAMAAAMFIVFATLSMGVAERTRTLAMLRAVGAQKGQIGRLVVFEGILLAILGVGVGLPLGWLWLFILTKLYPTVFTAGGVLSRGGMIYSSVGMIVAAVLASFLPAWNAMRVSALEAMAPLGQERSARTPWIAAAVGLLLITIDPLLIFVPGIPREISFWGHFILGVPALFLGFFLTSPAFVWIIEKTIGRLIAFVLRLDYSLLRQQLSGSLWRAAGTTTALMVGLAILVVMHVQSSSFLASWRLPNKFPDVMIVAPYGLDPQQQEMLEKTPGVRPGEVLPFAIASAELGGGVFSLGALALLPNATMFFGIDPDKTFQHVEFDFREGNAADAARMLKQGRHVIVAEEFRQLKGLKVGDKLPLKTALSGTVEYTIAGVIWSPGLDVIVSAYDMGRQLDQRTVSSVCGSIEDARRDFGVDRISIFAANLDYGIERLEMGRRLTEHMNKASTQPTTQPKASKSLGLNAVQMQKLLGRHGYIVADIRHIKHEIEQTFRTIVLLASTVALAAIFVASLGVTNTIMASIRIRQWQFGILRSVGLTRWELLRLILAEAALLGLVACALGLCTGFVLSADANGLSERILGYILPWVVPWNIIWLGGGIVVAVSLIASLFPAFRTAYQSPLDLLQWGRASA